MRFVVIYIPVLLRARYYYRCISNWVTLLQLTSTGYDCCFNLTSALGLCCVGYSPYRLELSLSSMFKLSLLFIHFINYSIMSFFPILFVIEGLKSLLYKKCCTKINLKKCRKHISNGKVMYLVKVKDLLYSFYSFLFSDANTL